MRKFLRYPFWLRFSLALTIVLSMAWGGSAVAQLSDFLPLRSLPLGETTQTIEGYAVGSVYLDGHRLFAVTAAPAPAKQDVSPLQERVNAIESILNKTLATDFNPDNPEDLQFVLEEDDKTRLLILKLNDQWLMTITPKDAEANGRTHTPLWARETIEIVRNALIQAKYDRQPAAIVRQIGFVCATIAGVLLFSVLSYKRQTYLSKQWSQLLEEKVTERPKQGIADPPTTEIQIKVKYLSKRNLCYLQIRLLQLFQLVIWSGGLFLALGFLSYTRWMQPLLLLWLPLPLKIIGISVATYLILRLSEMLVDRFFIALEADRLLDPGASSRVEKRFEKRFETIAQVFNGLTSTLVISLGILTGLSVFGIELGPVLAGAGIIGLGISFASQGLIKDFINGFFIILEDQYAVGDVIKVGEYAGLVENMNLRITQLRNGEGNLITLPNGGIAVVENLSKEWARANILFTVSYYADLNKVLDIVVEVTDELSRDLMWSDRILNAREVIGVENIAQDGVTILVWIRTKPLEQWSVGREFRRRLKYALEAHNIDIGIPQQKLFWQPHLDTPSDGS